MSFPRTVPDAVRQKDDARKKAREARQLAKEQRKQEKIEEIKRAKNGKKKEIVERLKQIQVPPGGGQGGGAACGLTPGLAQDIAGHSIEGLDHIDLEQDFDPDMHDKMMKSVFDE